MINVVASLDELKENARNIEYRINTILPGYTYIRSSILDGYRILIPEMLGDSYFISTMQDIVDVAEQIKDYETENDVFLISEYDCSFEEEQLVVKGKFGIKNKEILGLIEEYNNISKKVKELSDIKKNRDLELEEYNKFLELKEKFKEK